MKLFEYILSGGIGGALGAVALHLYENSGELLDLLAAGVLIYANELPLLLGAMVAGLITGAFSKSAIGGLIGGLAVPLAVEAWPLLQGAI